MKLLGVRVVCVTAGLVMLSGNTPELPRLVFGAPSEPAREAVFKVAKKAPKVAASAGKPLALKKRRRQLRRSRPGDIPKTAMRAYTRAARKLRRADAACRLTWPVLAGIGRVESDHGKLRAGTFTDNGTLVPRLVGPPLNGARKTKKIYDTDDGALDGDVYWDRAVGPMQFIPSTWRRFGTDGNGDGVIDANNVFDASLAAARYLCSGPRDLSSGYQLASALYSYNHSRGYVRLVLYVIAAYANLDAGSLIAAAGALAMPELDARPPRRTRKPGRTRTTSGMRSGGGGNRSGGGGSATNKRSKPAPSPDPKDKIIPVPTITLPTDWS